MNVYTKSNLLVSENTQFYIMILRFLKEKYKVFSYKN